MSIFSRLFLLFIGVGIVPVIPTGALLLYYQSASKSSTLNLHQSLSDITAVSVKQHMNTLANRMAFADDVDDYLKTGSLKKIPPALREAVKSNPDFLAAALLDEKGREVYKAGTAQTLRQLGYIDRHADPVFLRSKKTGQVALSNFEIVNGVPASAVIFPLKKGRFIFVEASFADLWDRIAEQSIGVTGKIYLATAQGSILNFSKDPSPQADAALREAFAKTSGKLENIKTPVGIFVGAFRQVPDASLFVVTLQQKNEAFWMIRLISSMIIFFILAIATASYFAALVFAKRLGDPIYELIEGSARVAGKNFDTPVDTSIGWGEFAPLLESFNAMMSEIKTYHALQLDKILDEKKKMDILISLMRDGIILTGPERVPIFTNHIAKNILSSISKSSDQQHADAIREIEALYFGEKPLQLTLPSGGTAYYKGFAEQFHSEAEGDLSLIVLRDITLEHEIDAMKEDFFASAAHDLRAPLLGIQGYLKLLGASSKIEGEDKEYVEAMRFSSGKIFKLIEDILELARMESGVFKPKPEEFRLSDCINETIEQLKPVAMEKKIELSFSCADESPVTADKRLIERVVSNLVSNALKFTPENGKISIIAEKHTDGMKVAVSDNGPGIPKEQLPLIFKKYRRANPETPGYGLGLVISRKIVEMHNGSINLESQEGKGTTVIFNIPEKPL